MKIKKKEIGANWRKLILQKAVILSIEETSAAICLETRQAKAFRDLVWSALNSEKRQ